MPEFKLDDHSVSFKEGQTIMQAALGAGLYIPHLCFHPDFKPHGSCRVCIVHTNGRYVSSCTTLAEQGAQVLSEQAEVQRQRRNLLEMLFIEGNHVCPSCEKSGSCTLQSVAEYCGMLSPSLPFQFPQRKVDASHPDTMLDFNRCILCELCVRASREVDRKSVFAIAGRGIQAHLVVDSDDGRLVNSRFASTDRAASVCPVGVILPKHKGFEKPIGQRGFDLNPVDRQQEKTD